MRDARISNRLALGGFAIIQDYVQLDGANAVFEGHALIMKAPEGDGYRMHWFDMFAPSLFEGSFDGASGVFVSDSPMGKTRATFDFSTAGAYTFKMEMSQDGENWFPVMDGEYERQ